MLALDLMQCEVTMELVTGQIKIDGWSESGDCLSFPEIEFSKVKRGADGKMVASRTGDFGGPVTIKVLANSPFVTAMSEFIQNFNSNGNCKAVNLKMNNTCSGDKVTCTNGVLAKGPSGVNYGKGEVGEMSYTFEFETINFDATTGDRTGPPTQGE
jgi:hypothetical protein